MSKMICTKCGEETGIVSKRYHKSGQMWDCRWGEPIGEHIAVFCPVCGYEEARPCVDSQESVSA